MRPDARRLAAVAALGSVLFAGACGAARKPESTPELQGAVLIVLDTARADRLSCYGYARQTSPAIDRLAKEGVLFEKVVSFAPWTLPSAASLLSGRPLGAAFSAGRLRVSLVEQILAAGYRTAAITEGGFFSAHFGFDLGFEEYVEEEGAVRLRLPGLEREPRPEGGIETTFRLARDWIATHRDERFFIMIQTYEPHTPYDRHAFTAGLDRGSLGEVLSPEMLPALQTGQLALTDAELRYVNALYDGGILESDRQVGEFLEFLDSVGLRDRLLVVITSDHGEELGEHYRSHVADHGHALFDEQVLVPLIIHDPRERYARSRVKAQVMTLDILPTIAEALGVDPGEGLHGASLVPLMRGEAEEDRPAFGMGTKAGPARAFLRHDGHKLIVVVDPGRGDAPLPVDPPRFQLYDLRSDPAETVNLAGEEPELLGRYLSLFESVGAGTGEGTELPDEMGEALRERLRSLGYLD